MTILARQEGNADREGLSTHILDLGASEASEGIGTVGGGYKTSLTKVVLCLEVSDLGLVRSVHDTDGD